MSYLIYKECNLKLDPAISRLCEFCNKKSPFTNYRLSMKANNEINEIANLNNQLLHILLKEIQPFLDNRIHTVICSNCIAEFNQSTLNTFITKYRLKLL